MNITDATLIVRAKTGDNNAVAELWARHERSVSSLCRRYLSGRGANPVVDHEDLATEVFIIAIHALDRYEDHSADGGGFRSWLLEITRRHCLKHLSRTSGLRFTNLSSQECEQIPDRLSRDVHRQVEERRLLVEAARAINTLPQTYRLPFKLHLEENSHHEIAAMLGISMHNAAKRVQRARAMLQPKLGSWIETDSGPSRMGRTPSLVQVESALTTLVSDYRVVQIIVPTGGEIQLCLRIDPQKSQTNPEIEALKTSVERRPDAWKKRLELAEIQYHSGLWADAREEYRQVLCLRPACYLASIRLSEMLAKGQRSSEAAVVLKSAIAHGAPPHEMARLQADLLAAERQDEQAVEVYYHAIALKPRDKENRYGLHAALGRLSRYQEQLDNLAEIRHIAPRDVFGYEQAYTPCARLYRFDISLPLMERAVELDPNYPPAIKHLFQCRMNVGIVDWETEQLAERLVRLAPDLAASWGELGWFYRATGRSDESISVMESYLAEHPESAEAHAQLAHTTAQAALMEKATHHARTAYRLSPSDWFVCWTFLYVLNGRNEFAGRDEALTGLAEIEQRLPMDSFLHVHISACYDSHGMPDEALAAAREAVLACPGSFEYAQLAKMLHSIGRFQESADAYERCFECEVPRKNPGWLACQAAVLHHLGDPRSEELFANAFEQACNVQELLMLGDSLFDCGKVQEALSAYRRGLLKSDFTPVTRSALNARIARIEAESPNRQK